MRATHGILPKRVEVANKVINKLAITWSRTAKLKLFGIIPLHLDI